MEARRESFSFSRLEEEGLEGVPRGALSQFSGPWGGGKTELLLRFLREHPRERVAWVEERFSGYPVGFEQKGVGLDRFLFVDLGRARQVPAGAGAHPLSIALQVLSSQLFGISVFNLELAASGEASALQLRRFQLAAERARCAAILLNEAPITEGRWPLALQLDVRRGEGEEPRIRVLKSRGVVWEPQAALG